MRGHRRLVLGVAVLSCTARVSRGVRRRLVSGVFLAGFPGGRFSSPFCSRLCAGVLGCSVVSAAWGGGWACCACVGLGWGVGVAGVDLLLLPGGRGGGRVRAGGWRGGGAGGCSWLEGGRGGCGGRGCVPCGCGSGGGLGVCWDSAGCRCFPSRGSLGGWGLSGVLSRAGSRSVRKTPASTIFLTRGGSS